MTSKNRTKSKKLYIIIAAVLVAAVITIIYIANKPLTDKQIFSLFEGEFEYTSGELYCYGPSELRSSIGLRTEVPTAKLMVAKDAYAGCDVKNMGKYAIERYDSEYFTISPVYYDVKTISQDNLKEYQALTGGLIEDEEALAAKKNVFILKVSIKDKEFEPEDNQANLISHAIIYIDGDYYFDFCKSIYSIKKTSDKADKLEKKAVKSGGKAPISPHIGEYELVSFTNSDPRDDGQLDFLYGAYMRIDSDTFVLEDLASRNPQSMPNENTYGHYVISNARYEVSPLTADSLLTTKDNIQKNVYDNFRIDEPLDTDVIIKITNDVQKEPVYVYVINGRYYMMSYHSDILVYARI